MSGIGFQSADVPLTGINTIDGLMTGLRWDESSITYGFADSASDYSGSYPTDYDFLGTFSAVSAMQEAAIRSILDLDMVSTAQAGFTVEGFTNLDISFSTAADTTIRAGNSSDVPYGYGYFPFTNYTAAGDIWFGDAYAGTSLDIYAPTMGNYAYLTHLHEIGHALGLHHSFGGHTSLASQYDHIEYTVMSYSSYEGGPNYYTSEQWGYSQTFMMLDIAALQHMYGANFSVNSGDTVYSWSPSSGQTMVDGMVGLDPGGARIFATLWDGGGIDTYDLSTYTSNLSLDLRPGEDSLFSSAQIANLGDGNFARANIYNALLYQGDLRSLIENAIGGTGNDSIQGNQADNWLQGGAGSDELYGDDGNDILDGGTQNDTLDGGLGADAMTGGSGNDIYYVDNAGDTITELGTAGSGYDIVNTTLNTFFLTDGDNLERVNFQGTGNFTSRGNEGDNRFTGAAGNDRFILDSGGADIFSGGQGRDAFDARSSTNGITIRLDDQSLHGGDAAGDTFASMESFFGSNTASDYMVTGAARARFSGFGGDDILIGGSTVDFLQGGNDNDELFGNGARDTLQGGYGNDEMTGGADRDQFLFVEAAFGQDTILDYEDGLDYLKVFSLVADDISDFIITGNGTSTVTLTLDDGTGNNTITLISHDGSNIHITAADFQFY